MDFINSIWFIPKSKTENGCLQPSIQHYFAINARDIIHVYFFFDLSKERNGDSMQKMCADTIVMTLEHYLFVCFVHVLKIESRSSSGDSNT
jgi:hypothetical protein